MDRGLDMTLAPLALLTPLLWIGPSTLLRFRQFASMLVGKSGRTRRARLFTMAVDAQRSPVGNIQTKRRVGGKRLDVVGLKARSARCAMRACKVVAAEHGRAPFRVGDALARLLVRRSNAPLPVLVERASAIRARASALGCGDSRDNVACTLRMPFGYGVVPCCESRRNALRAVEARAFACLGEFSEFAARAHIWSDAVLRKPVSDLPSRNAELASDALGRHVVRNVHGEQFIARWFHAVMLVNSSLASKTYSGGAWKWTAALS